MGLRIVTMSRWNAQKQDHRGFRLGNGEMSQLKGL
jgi:hypothetical protein